MFKSALLSVFVIASAASSTRAEVVGPPGPDFEPGQEWSIKSESPTTAKIIVGRVQTWRGRVAINISIVDIPVPQGMPGAGGTTQIDHIPFEKSALATSVDRLLATNVMPSPNFESSYKQWQDANGGIFTVSVETAIKLMFQTINRGRG